MAPENIELGTLGTQMVQSAQIRRKEKFSSNRMLNSVYISGNCVWHCSIIYTTSHLAKHSKTKHKNTLTNDHISTYDLQDEVFLVSDISYLSKRFMLMVFRICNHCICFYIFKRIL